MGYTQVTAKVTGRLSSHNADQDVIDRALWKALGVLVERMANRAPFNVIDIEIDWPTD